MKTNFTKTLILSAISLAFLSSCNNNDDNSESNIDTKKKVVTYIKETNSYDLDKDGKPIIEIQEGTLKYDEKYEKLLSLISVDNKIETKFIYDNNSLTSIKYISNNTLNSEVKIYYKNDLLNYTLTEEDGNITERHDYIFNTEKKLIRENICNNSEACDGSLYKKFSYTNNNITSINDKSWSWNNNTFPEQVYNFTFETSKNPFTNMQPILKIFYNDWFYSLNQNNIAKKVEFRNGTTTADREITYTYQLDKDNYPLTITGTDQTGRVLIKTEYKYNQ